MDTQIDERQRLIRMLSHALRHNPDEHFLDMDSEGWAEIDDVLLAVHCHRSRWRVVSRAELVEVATTAFGNRFEIAGDRIRALYGHSVPFVESGIERIPPTVLFHGTSKQAYESIQQYGLKPMARRLVHLTTDYAYAQQEMAIRRRKSCRVQDRPYTALCHGNSLSNPGRPARSGCNTGCPMRKAKST